MITYIIRRLIYTVPILIGVLLLTFLLFKVVGGDISYQIAGKNADPETIAEIRHEYGFDKPLFVGYELLEADADAWQAAKADVMAQLKAERPEGEGPAAPPPITEEQARDAWLGELFETRVKNLEWATAARMLDFDSQFVAHFVNAVTFDFGRGLDRELILDKIARGVGPSVSLTIPIFLGYVSISISLSLLVAYKRGTAWDFVTVLLAVAGMSLPYLSFIIFGQYFFAYKYDWFPIMYMPEQSVLYSLGLPILIGVVASLGSNLRFYRTIMLDEMRSDYVRTAYAKGLATPKVLFKHVLKNALIPIITSVVLAIPYLFLGSLLLERFFGIPGLGSLMIEAIASRDMAIIGAMTYISALLIIFFTLLTDLCYAWADPRIQFE